jgi:hypothetical protein
VTAPRHDREVLLHPVCLAAIGLLVLNDHWLKAHDPSWLTGKLSDAAGLVVFPLVLAALVRSRAGVAVAATALGFALVKTVPAATDAYRYGLGTLQWPFAAASAVWHDRAVPGLVPVEAVTDPTDLIALPFVLVPLMLMRRCSRLARFSGRAT